MIFPSYIFLLAFLPAVLMGWYAIRSLRLRLAFLTLASYVFYGWWDYRFVALMLGSTLLDYLCGWRIHGSTNRRRRRMWLGLSIAGNLSALGFFKYYGFFTDSLRELLGTVGWELSLPTLQVILPLGISFYTFQSMSYTIDIYRGKCRPTRDLLRFTAYVSMFPQLVAGPIVRYEQMEQQLEALPNARPDGARMCDGVWLFMIGLAKKVWIADTLAPVAALAFDQTQGPQFFTAWAGALGYTFQLYFDFSGYSDMARGLGLLLGFEFPVNFNSPYKAANISEFWNRWHITLSHWLRDYLYIPLGGSRYGTSKTLRNLGITMLLGGLWHGAAWSFVVWGAYHGGLLIAHACWRRLTSLSLPRPAAIAGTFLVVTVGWVIFRANSVSGAFDVLAGMLGMHGVEAFTYPSATLGIDLPVIYGQFAGLHGVAFLLAVTGLAFLAPNSEQVPKPRHPIFGVVMGVLALVTLTTFMEETPFLYFTF